MITRANRRIFVDSSEKIFHKSAHLNLAFLMGDLKMTLTHLDHDMTTSGLPVDESRPTRDKAAKGPVGSRVVRKISAVLNFSRGARFCFWQNGVSR